MISSCQVLSSMSLILQAGVSPPVHSVVIRQVSWPLSLIEKVGQLQNSPIVISLSRAGAAWWGGCCVCHWAVWCGCYISSVSSSSYTWQLIIVSKSIEFTTFSPDVVLLVLMDTGVPEPEHASCPLSDKLTILGWTSPANIIPKSNSSVWPACSPLNQSMLLRVNCVPVVGETFAV